MGGSVQTMTIGHWVDGRAVEGGSGRTAPVFDPAAGSQTRRGRARVGGRGRRRCGRCRSRAAADWGSSSLSTRTNLLFRLRELLAAGRDELAAAVTREHGKVLDDARGEVARGLENVEFACGIPHLLKGAAASEVSTGVDIRTVLQPVGVVAGITPFNFPVMVPLWMMANAIACGNTFVLKPSEKDPVRVADPGRHGPARRLPRRRGQRRAGRQRGGGRAADPPGGRGGLLRGQHARGAPRLRDGHPPRQTRPGARRRQEPHGRAPGRRPRAAPPMRRYRPATGRRASGAWPSPCVVAVGSVADDLVDAIARADPRCGGRSRGRPGLDDGAADHRPSTAIACGPTWSRPPTKGRGSSSTGRTPPARTGFFLGCSLLDDVKPGMRVYDDEIFGPVLGVVRVPTLDEAIALVNANPYGNGTAIFTRDGGAARRFEREIQVGMVGINVPIPVPVASHSFGGWKDVALRRRRHLRTRGDPLLHPPEGRDVALARARHQPDRPRIPHDPLSAPRHPLSVCSGRVVSLVPKGETASEPDVTRKISSGRRAR